MHWRHHFKPVAVQNATLNDWCSKRKSEITVGRLTYVLSKCACGQTKTEKLDGEWTLQDLQQQAAPTKTDSELNLLRQIAGLKKK